MTQHAFIPEIQKILSAEHIDCAAVIPFSACRVINPKKLAQFGLSEDTVQSALVFLAPYHPNPAGTEQRSISVYSAARDYHVYFKGFFERVCPALCAAFPGYTFSGSADNAPIDERHAAIAAGLGMAGDSGMLINETYGTYVFIGEILSDLPWNTFYETASDKETVSEPFVPQSAECVHCGACRRSCPMNTNPFGIRDCLSAVNQTKRLETLCTEENGKTEQDYLDYIRFYGCAWGCDRCQTPCPHNAHAKATPIPFFRENLTPNPSSDDIRRMTDEEFCDRAYAWRKRSTVMRNLELLEADEAAGLPRADTLEAILAVIRRAGSFMRSAHDMERQAGAIDEKAGDANFVTVYDVRVQEMLLEELHRVMPDADFFAEEKDNDPAMLAKGHTFIIDPIDGTTNFIHNYGISAISVGLLWNGVPVFGAIYDPYREMLYEARRDIGAFVTDRTGVSRKLRVSDRPMEKGVFAVGTSPYYRAELGDRTFAMMRRLFDAGADIRRLGSAALDLAAVAAGVADGYCEMLISPWDFAAGALLVTEAGGIITDLDGKPLDFSHPTGVIAGTPATHQRMVEVCRTEG